MSVNGINVANGYNANGNVTLGKTQYENPVSKKWEYYSAAVPTTLGCATLGTIAGLISKYGLEKSGKFSALIGVGVGLAAAAWALPSALYHKSVDVFGKQKEYDSYSRAKSAEIKLAEQIDQGVDNNNDLDKSIDQYAKFSYAKSGKGVGLINM